MIARLFAPAVAVVALAALLAIVALRAWGVGAVADVVGALAFALQFIAQKLGERRAFGGLFGFESPLFLHGIVARRPASATSASASSSAPAALLGIGVSAGHGVIDVRRLEVFVDLGWRVGSRSFLLLWMSALIASTSISILLTMLISILSISIVSARFV